MIYFGSKCSSNSNSYTNFQITFSKAVIISVEFLRFQIFVLLKHVALANNNSK